MDTCDGLPVVPVDDTSQIPVLSGIGVGTWEGVDKEISNEINNKSDTSGLSAPDITVLTLERIGHRVAGTNHTRGR